MVELKNPSADAIAEAAIWAARLRSEARTARAEEEFRSWLTKSDDHVAAFETVTDAWELAGGAAAEVPAAPARKAWRVPALACLVVLAGLGVFWSIDSAPAFATAVGEQRTVTLSDGTRVLMNTDTELVERFSAGRRTVVMERGEASFDVVHDSMRPFVVEAGESHVVALGTVFDVRWTSGALAVTLAEGRVRVIESAAAGADQEIELSPGQRLEDRANTRPTVQAVNLGTALAWRSGQVIFDETPLDEAAAEMNRYTPLQIELEGRGASRIRVSGAFRTGGSAEFARAVRDLYDFDVRQDGNRLIISPGHANP